MVPVMREGLVHDDLDRYTMPSNLGKDTNGYFATVKVMNRAEPISLVFEPCHYIALSKKSHIVI